MLKKLLLIVAAALVLAFFAGRGGQANTAAGTEKVVALEAKAECTDVARLPGDGGTWRLPVVDAEDELRVCYLGQGSDDRVRGMHGPAVRALQSALRRCNGQELKVDGVYGPETRRAVIDVQRSNGLRRDGVYGPETGRAMSWELAMPDGSHSCRSAADLFHPAITPQKA